jgi:hypothetical protein
MPGKSASEECLGTRRLCGNQIQNILEKHYNRLILLKMLCRFDFGLGGSEF